MTSETLTFEAAIMEIDRAKSDLRRGVLVPYEAVLAITSSVNRCIGEGALAADERELLVSYAIDTADELAENVSDPEIASIVRSSLAL